MLRSSSEYECRDSARLFSLKPGGFMWLVGSGLVVVLALSRRRISHVPRIGVWKLGFRDTDRTCNCLQMGRGY